MKNSLIAVALVLTLGVSSSSCYTMTHQVGTGASAGQTVEKRQWYALWGLLPVGEVDSHEMAGGAANYTVKTEQNVVDVIIGFFTSWVSFVPFTVEVQK